MKTIHIDKTKAIAFTGHRQLGMDTSILEKDLTHQLLECYQMGYSNFMVGGAVGFDMLVAEVVLKLKKEFESINLFIAVPYKGHYLYFRDNEKGRYKVIAEQATNIILSERYYKACFLHRNDYMLANCSLLVAYYDGSFRSGTGYTIRRAEQNNISIINLHK